MIDRAHLHTMLYEIALSIGNSLDLRLMLKQALPTYLRKLNGSAVGVLAYRETGEGRRTLEVLHVLPRSFTRSADFAGLSECVPWFCSDEEWTQVRASLPIRWSAKDGVLSIMALGDWGLLFLVSRHKALDLATIRALTPLNTKLAAACQACRQREALLASDARSRDDHQRLQAIMDTVQAGVMLLDAETHEIIEANAAALHMFGARKEEVLGHVCHKHICPGEKNHCPITDLGQTTDRSQRAVLRLSGEKVPVLKTVVSLSLGGRRMLLETFVDITEQKRFEKQLSSAKEIAEAASEAKSAFLTNMSHEIRTPMTAILGYADELVEGMDPEHLSAEQIDAAHTIKRNGQHLLNLINDILDLSKIEAGDFAIGHRPCALRRLVQDVVLVMQRQADAKGLEFRIEYEGGIPETIRTDPTRVRQILINVLGNAFKFTNDGTVTLASRYTPGPNGDGEMVFDVTDTGIGMTPEQVEGLFAPFSQVDGSVTRRFGGTGLGLALSVRLARLLGGDIQVQKTAVDGGTTFRVRFPAVRSEESSEADVEFSTPAPLRARPRTPADEQRGPLAGLRVLFAEDGPDNQRLIGHFLCKDGAEVSIVENGRQAVDAALKARAEGRPFDIILMDMQMPVMDGYAATRCLREEGCDRPIIALTAHAMTGDRDACLDAGCDDYATKPIDRQTLTETVLRYVHASAIS